MKQITLICTLFLFCHSLFADEGMWTLDNLPKKRMKQNYDFSPTKQWSEHVQLSSVRLANGCSGSFISNNGLVMTNHHCVRGCVQNLSSKKNDYISNGFHAKKTTKEKQCPAFEVNQLIEVTDVTKTVLDSTRGKEGKAYADAKKAIQSKLEKECSNNSDKFRCDTVNLYNGGQYKLYKYLRYQDVRLAFAPENKISEFGGDPDNFNFPRYALDMSLLRVYEGGKPLKNKNWFRWAKNEIKKGEMTFITGHPGRTSRLEPVSLLKFYRDFLLPRRLINLSEKRGMLHQYSKKSSEAKRISKATLNGVENGFKALFGRLSSLQNADFFNKLETNEKNLRHQVNRNRWYKKKYASAWNNIEKAIEKRKNLDPEFTYIGYGTFGSKLFGIARSLVRNAEEVTKPNEKRLSEYADARMPGLKQKLFSPAPIYNDFEKLTMEFELTKMREHLSPDHNFVKMVLGKKSPEQLSHSLISKTKLKNIKYRKKLFKGGLKAIQNSKDPMILLALKVDKESRRVREISEEVISPVFSKNLEKIAQARFDIYGTDQYPDATFTLRLSYGKVQGFPEKGKTVEPFTHIAGAYKRATGSEPFELPKSWLKSKKSLNLQTPFNFVSTNDIIGGNSGSPVINRDAEIIGLVFDGNIHSLGGAYGYDQTTNRAVSVHGSLMLEALKKVYKADSILKEIEDARTPL